MANTRDREKDVAPKSGLSNSGNLTPIMKFTPDRPPLPWQRKCENYDTKLSLLLS